MTELDLPPTTLGRTYGPLLGLVGERVDDAALDVRGPQIDLDTGALGGGDDDPTTSAGPDGTVAPGTPDGEPSTGGPTAGTVGGPTGASTDAATGTTVAAGPRTASDVGVTADTIRIGLLVPTSAEIGNTTSQSEVQVAEFRAFTDDINARGGIHGRQIEIRTATYDILDQNEGARAGCLKLADDDRVFAVFNTTGYGPPGTLCLTREKGVPFLQASGHPQEIYAQSNGLYSSTFDNQTRNFRNMVGTLHELGALRGQKVGVLGTEWLGLRRQQEEGIVDTLRRLGYDPFVYWLSGDPVSSQTQIPIAVQQMRSNGVTAVMLGADFISGQSFVSQADGQGYRPFYGAADSWGYTTDYVVESMPSSFEGAITVTAMRLYDARVGVAEPAIDAACARRFEEATGVELDRANDPDALYVGTQFACGVVQRFERAALAAGPNLTRAGLMAAIAAQGTVEVPFAGGPATYGPTKLDGADHYRPQRWHVECRCWRPLLPAFAKGRY